jgi:hypothetical protein
MLMPRSFLASAPANIQLTPSCSHYGARGRAAYAVGKQTLRAIIPSLVTRDPAKD